MEVILAKSAGFCFGVERAIKLVYEAQAQGLEKLREAHIDESVLRLKGLEALRDVADGRATKIYMPTDISKVVSTLGVVSESLGIGDSTPVDKSAKPVKKPEICIKSIPSRGPEESPSFFPPPVLPTQPGRWNG